MREAVVSAVAALERGVRAAPAPADDPLFIFSAGWGRDGTHELHRVLDSAATRFVPDDSQGQTDLVRRLAEALRPFGEGGAQAPAPLPEGSVEASRVIDAHRRFLRERFAPQPAGTSSAWGMHGLRLSAEYALYLRMLFPQGRFVFLLRDPRDAYRSHRDRTVAFGRWPRSQLRAPYTYGQAWRRRAQSFLDHRETLEASVLRYEDLLDRGEALEHLEQLLGGGLNRSALVSTGPSRTDAGRPGPTALELTMLDLATQPTAATLGYRPPA